jgi:hypothetical protein
MCVLAFNGLNDVYIPKYRNPHNHAVTSTNPNYEMTDLLRTNGISDSGTQKVNFFEYPRPT